MVLGLSVIRVSSASIAKMVRAYNLGEDQELTVKAERITALAVFVVPTLPNFLVVLTEKGTRVKVVTPTSGEDHLISPSTFPTRSILPKPRLCFVVVSLSTRP